MAYVWTVAPPTPNVGWRDRAFYTGMSLAVLAAVFLGFARTYFLRSSYFSTPLPLIAHVHGAIFFSWTVLFFVQTALIAGRRTALHRQLGVFGGVLAAAMVVAGSAIAVVTLRAAVARGDMDALSFFIVPVGDMLIFAVLVTAAMAFRLGPETHKRLMLLATIVVLEAATSRWPLAIVQGVVGFSAVNDLFLLAGVVYDAVSRRRVHSVYLWGGLLIVGTQVLRLIIGPTDAWRAFARIIAG